MDRIVSFVLQSSFILVNIRARAHTSVEKVSWSERWNDHNEHEESKYCNIKDKLKRKNKRIKNIYDRSLTEFDWVPVTISDIIFNIVPVALPLTSAIVKFIHLENHVWNIIIAFRLHQPNAWMTFIRNVIAAHTHIHTSHTSERALASKRRINRGVVYLITAQPWSEMLFRLHVTKPSTGRVRWSME